MPSTDSTVRLLLPGRPISTSGAAAAHIDVAQFLEIKEKAAVAVGVSLRGAPVETVAVEANFDDVVELQYEGGLSQWIRVDQLREDLQRRNGPVTRGATDDRDLVIPPDLGVAPTRGAADLLLKGLKVLGIDPVGAAANLAVRETISKFEHSLQPAPGLYVLSDPRTAERKVRDVKELDNRAPYLLFLHGTASSIAGSFGGFTPSPEDTGEPILPEDWDALKKRYPGRILGLQHKTLSVSPIANALDVAKLLPEGAQLHLVSHSRGGLIGELLCLSEVPDEHRKAFAKAARDLPEKARSALQEARQKEAELIDQLAAELSGKRFNVQRFVRVASPARGTVLASKRLDLYLSVLLNVFGLIPVLKASSLYALLKAVTIETARRRTDPRELPGIEAMMPESPLIHLLNQKDLMSAADLAVIAGDLAPEGLWQRLKTLAVELFYLQPNDLVVNTGAMYGGMERRTAASYFFNKGPHVNHFHYFRNKGTRGLLRKWLEAGPGEKVDGFRPFTPAQTEFVADSRRAGNVQEPEGIVVVVPDFMGTQMLDDTGLIWPSISGLAKRGLDRLADGARPGTLIPGLYAPMIARLQQSYRVETVPYDWRKGVDEIAAALRAKLETCLSDTSLEKRPIHCIAHGAGAVGLIQLAGDAGFWEQVAARNGRVVLLGTPIRGSAGIAYLRDANSRLNRLLQMADHQSDRTAESFFNGLKMMADLTPNSPKQTSLGDPAKIKNIFAITGKAERTLCGIRDDGAVLYTSSGDGLVTSEASQIKGISTWQVNAPHGMLGRHELLTEALMELLAQGTVTKLPRAAANPAVADVAPLLAEEPLFFPDEDDLLNAALGGKPPSQFEAAENLLRVSVSHGHLRQAKFSVMVGHYQNDMIVSAEKELDKHLKGRLRQRFNMGIYPGRVNTVEIVLEAKAKAGALVIGLGEVGELTPEKLRRGVRTALIRYALLLAEEAQVKEPGPEPQEANFSAVLMGTYGQGSVRDAVSAVVHGALDANRQLKQQSLDDQVRVGEIEFIELYQDIATEAAHELLTLAERLNGDAVTGSVISAEPRVLVLEGGRTSRPANPYATGWWRRIKINRKAAEGPGAERPDGLEFTVLTDRARVDDFVRGTQRQVLEPMLRQATRQSAWDQDLSAVLFQLLIPRDLRSYTQDRVNMVLILDEDAAKYPWELLAQRTRTGVEPLAVQCGLLRQLRSNSFERRMNPASGTCAVVIGDTQSGWTPLHGAVEEAKTVQGRLKQLYPDTELLEKKDGMTIISALLSRELRIIHLAGHGNFDPNDELQRGMKIGPDQWLTPDILDGMLAAPDLVFVNCCYLGTIKGAKEGTPSPELGASFAVKLMNLGVKAVVAAGWAVDDGAARVFADRFYERMLEGERFGDAVLDARQRTKEAYPHSNTWGAYQCYGNPDFRLEGGTGQKAAKVKSKRFVAREEILQQVTDLASQTSDAKREDVLTEIEALREQTPAEWRDGEMLAAFGNAYAQWGEFAEAIAAYRQALADETGRAPLRAAQQIANLLDRSARKLTGEQQAVLRKEALDWLEKVAPLADTAELAALRAGYYKRVGDLEKAQEAYLRAFEMHKRTRSDGLFYPGLNAAAIAFVLGKNEEFWRPLINDCADAAARQRESKRDVWSRAGVVDALLMAALWDDTVAEKQDEIAKAYVKVGEGGGAKREVESILGQIEFLRDRLPSGHAAKEPLQGILNQINVYLQ